MLSQARPSGSSGAVRVSEMSHGHREDLSHTAALFATNMDPMTAVALRQDYTDTIDT